MNSVKPPTLGRLPKGSHTEGGISKGGERHKSRRARNVWNDEAIEIVKHRACDDFAKGAAVPIIGTFQRPQIRAPLFLEDDNGRIPQPHEDQVEGKASGPSVSIQERVNALELVMDTGKPFRKWGA